jgi:hypothetical protein
MPDVKNTFGGIDDSFRFLEGYNSKWPRLVFMLLFIIVVGVIGFAYSFTENPGYAFYAVSFFLLYLGTIAAKTIVERLFGKPK